MGINFRQIDNLQNTFDGLSGSFDAQISNNTNDISGVYNDAQTLSGWKYFDSNVDVSGFQGLLVENDNIYTPNDVIVGNSISIGETILNPRNNTPAPAQALHIIDGNVQIDLGNIEMLDGSLTLSNGDVSIIQGGIFLNGIEVATVDDITDYQAASGISLSNDTFTTSGTGYFDSVGIGTNAPESILDISSTSSAPIMPRMTTEQMNAIPDPVSGMLIFNTDSGKFAGYTGAWSTLH